MLRADGTKAGDNIITCNQSKIMLCEARDLVAQKEKTGLFKDVDVSTVDIYCSGFNYIFFIIIAFFV